MVHPVAISGLGATKDKDKNPIIQSKNAIVAQGCSVAAQTQTKKCAKKSGKYVYIRVIHKQHS